MYFGVRGVDKTLGFFPGCLQFLQQSISRISSSWITLVSMLDNLHTRNARKLNSCSRMLLIFQFRKFFCPGWMFLFLFFFLWKFHFVFCFPNACTHTAWGRSPTIVVMNVRVCFPVCKRTSCAPGGSGADERHNATGGPNRQPAAADQQRSTHQRAAGHPGWTQYRTPGYHWTHDLSH